MIVAVLAGGRGRRMGGAKAMAELDGAPLIARPLAAARAAGLEAVVVAKRATPLPAGRAGVASSRTSRSHPLAGLVTALEHGAGDRRRLRPAVGHAGAAARAGATTTGR